MSQLGLLNAVFLVLPTIIAVYLGFHALKRGNIPGAIPFTMAMLIVGVWSVTCLLVVVTHDPQTALFWVKLMLAAVPYLPVAILVAVMRTSVREKAVNPRLVAILLIVPTITALLTLTPIAPRFYIYDIQLAQVGTDYIGWTNSYGPWSAIHLSYSYALVAYAVVLLIQQFIRMRYNIYRMRILLLCIGLALPFITNIANTLLTPVHYFITPIMFNISSPILFWAVFRYRLFEVLPVARDQAFENMNDAIVILDVDNQIADVNPKAAQLAGQSAEALLAKPLFTGFASFEEALHPLLAGTVNHQTISVQQGSEARYFDVTISPIHYEQAQVGKLIILHDRTEQQQAELRARQAEIERARVNSLSDFIEAASHEFRTPLSTIKSSTFVISRTEDATKRAEKIAQIDAEANRISQLVEALINVVRVNASGDLNLIPTDVNTSVAEAKLVANAQAVAKNIRVEVDCAPDLPPINADAAYLAKAFDAVMHNAIRYTPDGGCIKLTTCQRDSQVIITIQDNGIGIDPEQLPHIFDVFYRVDKARTTAGFGTGLTIASRIVALHGGQIHAASKPGEGTTMTITLPVAA